MLKSQLQKYAAPVLDEDFCNIVVSAVRYALPRHSYMPSLTRHYLKQYWPLIKAKHWCILRDIRDHYKEALFWMQFHPEDKQFIDVNDLNAWVHFYNYLIEREDTHWPDGERHQHTPIKYVGEQN